MNIGVGRNVPRQDWILATGVCQHDVSITVPSPASVGHVAGFVAQDFYTSGVRRSLPELPEQERQPPILQQTPDCRHLRRVAYLVDESEEVCHVGRPRRGIG